MTSLSWQVEVLDSWVNRGRQGHTGLFDLFLYALICLQFSQFDC